MTASTDEEFYLAECCYQLRRLGLSTSEISKRVDRSQREVLILCRLHAERIKRGLATDSPLDRGFWEDTNLEVQGDPKVTFAGQDGFYHCRQSDLEKMDPPTLMKIYESSKLFLDLDGTKRFLDFKPPVGYDPLALAREVKKAVGIIEQILQKGWGRQKAGTDQGEAPTRT